MTITPSLFAAFLKCPSKCWLRAANETPSGNPYAEWVQSQNESYRASQAERLLAAAPPGESARAPAPEKLKASLWRLAVDVAVQAKLPAPSGGASAASTTPPAGPSSSGPRGARPSEGFALETSLQAVERVPAEGRGKAAQFTPIRFTFFNKLTRDDKLLLGFDACVLSAALGREITAGKLIHGDDHATLKVKTPAQAGEVRKRLSKLAALLASPTPPDLVLNRHCAECEFQARCRQKAVETDDLSLLGGMSAKERQKLRSKGIFTVTQLSYTFRPRRRPKRLRDKREKYHHSLKALAIREKKIHIAGSPELKIEGTPVYLDVEGLPDRDFYYLIGLRIGSGETAVQHSLWADTVEDEGKIWREFLAILETVEKPVLIHYGSYETIFIKTMSKRYGAQQVGSTAPRIFGHAVNLLSFIFGCIYFPTYSNSLKEIVRFLGLDLHQESTTGIQTIAWRTGWEADRKPEPATGLVHYNKNDCQALDYLHVVVQRITSRESTNAGTLHPAPDVIQIEELKRERARWELFKAKEYALEDFQRVSKCAYFDYQREKVLVRTYRQFKSVNKRHRKRKRTNLRPNSVVEVECHQCPSCGKKRVNPVKQTSRLLVDLKFSRTGVKKWITEFRVHRYACPRCGSVFSAERGFPNPPRYGHSFMSWCVYSNIFCGVNMNRTRIALGDIFQIFVDESRMLRSRHVITGEYKQLYNAILESLVHEKVLHIDETTVKLRGVNGYVWVLAGIDKVYFFYKPSREGSFLLEMLACFRGVLVSDFYVVYDSLPCKQQKCLVHFVRDIDDDLLRHPFDSELKAIAQNFGTLLRAIIETVDRYGLKARHLQKHRLAVRRFLDLVGSGNLTSELANKYKNRFQKSGDKMFTFLEHDGVPWNNNNAEHAIKRFAKFRVHADGRFTERSLGEYLTLVSLFETCEFNNVNVLEFLLSGERTLDGLVRLAGRKTQSSVVLPIKQSGGPLL